MISSARVEAYRILYRVETERAYASHLLSAPQFNALSNEDRGLAYEIVMGVLRWQRRLDFLIERYTKRPLHKLDIPVILALRLGLYQIRFLKRIPDWAAVNESVQLVKKHGVGSAARFVNAVLRKACQRREDWGTGDIEDELELLSIELSHPRWLVEKWVRQWGREAALALMKTNNTVPPITLRLNPLGREGAPTDAQLEHEHISLEPSCFVPGAYRVTEGTLSDASPLVNQGQVYIQDEASQLVAHLLNVRPGMRVLDLCAAPGSKTSQLAAMMQNVGLIVAGDLHWHRLKTLIRTCQRLGATIVYPVSFDGTQPLPFLPHQAFDRILVDAPCSGTGTLRHHPEIKWRLQQADLEALAATQLRLLESAASLLAADGILIYSTCSMEPEENQAIVSKFLKERPGLKLLKPAIDETIIDSGGFVKTTPHQHGMDGFFAALLCQR